MNFWNFYTNLMNLKGVHLSYTNLMNLKGVHLRLTPKGYSPEGVKLKRYPSGSLNCITVNKNSCY